jgi:hypothetical protein
MNGIQIYKGRYFVKAKTVKKSQNKVIVFDLDETLGSFVDLEILWNTMLFDHTQENFNKLMDLYPEFLRYGILNIIDFLYYKKQVGYCYKLFIYTNNQLAKSWTSMIVKYLEQKQNTPKLFDQLICAFKINDIVIEPKRTTHDKTYSDFIKCSLLPQSSEICFIDDKYFKSMAQDKVYYIQPKPYHHSLTTLDIIRRFRSFDNKDHSTLLYPLFEHRGSVVKSESDIDIDRQVSNKMMYHLQLFFFMTTARKRTQRMKNSGIGKFTRKRSPRSNVLIRHQY